MNETGFLSLLKKTYPNSSVRFMGAGWSSTAFLVDDYIVRFPKRDMDDYLHEMAICADIKSRVSFEIPEVEIIINGDCSFARHKCLGGRLWEECLNEPIRPGLATDCAVFLSQIHGIHFLTKVRCAPLSQKQTPELIEKKLSRYYSGMMLSKLCYLYEDCMNYKPKTNVFLHADFHPGNVVLDNNGGIGGVFDWCNSGMGERERDFIHLHNIMERNFMKKLYSEYYFYCGVIVNNDRVKSLALVELINKFYWAKDGSEFELQMQNRIERVLR